MRRKFVYIIMRSNNIIFICLILVFTNASSQVYINLNPSIVFPTSYPSVRYVDFGAGLGITAGYSYKNEVDFAICLERLKLFSILDDHYIFSLKGNLKYYYFRHKGYTLYSGVMIGYFCERYKNVLSRTVHSLGIGAGPTTGINILLGKRIELTSELNFTRHFVKSKFNLVGLNVGIKYNI